MAQAKKNFTQKSKRMDDSSEDIDKKGRVTDKTADLNRSASKQPVSSKDKLGKREASRK